MSLDLSGPLYDALSSDTTITSQLGLYAGAPSIHTRRPVPEGAEYPMVLVSPDISVDDEDILTRSRPVIIRDISVYGQLDRDYRVVENIAYYMKTKFHRNRFAFVPVGYRIIDVVTTGPIPAPADDAQHIGRVVTLTIRLQEE